MAERVAITRDVSPGIARCELTHLERAPIDVDRARAQHDAYREALGAAGYRVERLPTADDLPDSVFVEDTAIVLRELAIIMRPGAESRRPEVPAVARALARYRDMKFVAPPGTIDGGDVLVAGRRVFVGRSSRTNAEAINQLRRMLLPHGYSVCAVPVHGALHLKSAATAIGDDALLVNPQWVDRTAFADFHTVEIDAAEPGAANVLRLHDRLIAAAAFPRTNDRLRADGIRVEAVDVSELAKAEGAVTCCSLIVET